MIGLLDILQTAWPILLLGILAGIWVTLANKSQKHDHDKKRSAQNKKE